MNTLVVVGYDDPYQAEEVHLKLKPGGSALFALVRKETPDQVLDALKGMGGRILKSSLSHEDEQKLQAALTAAHTQAQA